MTDVELDERVTALEENDGGGNFLNGKLHVFYKMMQQAYIYRSLSVIIY